MSVDYLKSRGCSLDSNESFDVVTYADLEDDEGPWEDLGFENNPFKDDSSHSNDSSTWIDVSGCDDLEQSSSRAGVQPIPPSLKGEKVVKSRKKNAAERKKAARENQARRAREELKAFYLSKAKQFATSNNVTSTPASPHTPALICKMPEEYGASL